MSDNIFIKDVVEEIANLTKFYRDQFRDEFKGLSWGLRGLPDDQFRNWFESKALENPNWVLALPYVEGGMRELSRYERIMGLRGED